MKLFDYIFYVAYLFYSRFGDPSRPTGATISALCQLCNIAAIFFFVVLNIEKKLLLSKGVIIIVIMTLIIANIYRYNTDSIYKKIEVEWESKSYSAQQWISFFVVLYIAISVILAVKMAIYAGKSGI